MKQTALALSHLVETRFRQDALEIIGFDRTARRLTPVQLADVEPEWVQGTNLQHALMIAARHLRRHPDAEPVVLVVTDGEPTAHLARRRARRYFHWPTTHETLRATVGQVDELTRFGAAINFFMLGDDPGLRPVRRRDGPPRRRPGVHPRPRPARGVRRRRLPPLPPRPPLTRRRLRARALTRRESARRGGADPATLAAGGADPRDSAASPEVRRTSRAPGAPDGSRRCRISLDVARRPEHVRPCGRRRPPSRTARAGPRAGAVCRSSCPWNSSPSYSQP